MCSLVCATVTQNAWLKFFGLHALVRISFSQIAIFAIVRSAEFGSSAQYRIVDAMSHLKYNHLIREPNKANRTEPNQAQNDERHQKRATTEQVDDDDEEEEEDRKQTLPLRASRVCSKANFLSYNCLNQAFYCFFI